MTQYPGNPNQPGGQPPRQAPFQPPAPGYPAPGQPHPGQAQHGQAQHGQAQHGQAQPGTWPGAQGYPAQGYPAQGYPSQGMPTNPNPQGGQYPAPPTGKGSGLGMKLGIAAAAILLLGGLGVGGVVLATRGGDDKKPADNAANTSTSSTGNAGAQTPIRVVPADVLPTDAQLETATLQKLKSSRPTPWTTGAVPAITDPTICSSASEPFNKTVLAPAVAVAMSRSTDTGDGTKYAVLAQPGVAVFSTNEAAQTALTAIRDSAANCKQYRLTDAKGAVSDMSATPGSTEGDTVTWTTNAKNNWACGRSAQVYRNVLAIGTYCAYGNTGAAGDVASQTITNVKAKAQN